MAAALLTGCGSGRPVSNGATNPPLTAAPTRTPRATAATPAPSATPVQTYRSPAPYKWPMAARSLFSPDAAPDDFSCPLYLSGDGRMFLYATKDGNVRKALWEGEQYGTTPVAENVDARPGSVCLVDEAGQRLYCAGSRPYGNGATGPAIVSVSLLDGARCNLDEAAQWKEEGCTVSADFQYCSGRVLARLADAQGKALDRWAIFDVATRSYTVLDMAGFLSANMPDWRDMVSIRLALAGGDRLLAFCTAGERVAPSAEATPATGSSLAAAETAPAGTAPAAAKPYECYVFTLDLKGKAASGGTLVAGSDQPECSRIQGGSRFSASPDGKFLLYAGPDGGLYVYDIDGNAEYTVAAGGSGYVFAEWGKDGSVYYGTAAQGTGNEAKLYRASVAEIRNPK